MLRCFARRSTNWRATTSSIVLEALFTSMPWSRLSSAVTSWLVVPSNSAILKIRTVAKRFTSIYSLRVVRGLVCAGLVRALAARRSEDLFCGLSTDARDLRQLLGGGGGDRFLRRQTRFDQLADGLLADAGERVGDGRVGGGRFGRFSRLSRFSRLHLRG